MRKALIAVGVIAVLVGSGFLLLSYTPIGFFLIAFQQNPGRFQRQAYEAVVAQIRNAELRPGEPREFIMDSVSNPKLIHPWKPDQGLKGLTRRGDGAGHVSAEVSPDGKLKVVIETRDLGHAGEFGFAYSDVPLSPKPFGDGVWFLIDVPSHLDMVQPSMKIDDHWWEVLYNLD